MEVRRLAQEGERAFKAGDVGGAAACVGGVRGVSGDAAAAVDHLDERLVEGPPAGEEIARGGALKPIGGPVDRVACGDAPVHRAEAIVELGHARGREPEARGEFRGGKRGFGGRFAGGTEKRRKLACPFRAVVAGSEVHVGTELEEEEP